MAILNATQSIPSTSITPPVVIIRKPFSGPASIAAPSGAAPQAQQDTAQMSSAADDCAAPLAELLSEANHVSIESDSSSLAYTSMISLPMANEQTSHEEAYVPASPFFFFFNSEFSEQRFKTHMNDIIQFEKKLQFIFMSLLFGYTD